MKWLLLLLIPGLAVATPLDDAVDWLGNQGANRVTIEAGAAAGMDIRAWPEEPAWGQFVVPAGNVRALHAAALTAYNPADFLTPQGTVDVVALLRANHAGVMAEGRAATLAFHILAMHAAGIPHDDHEMEAAAQALSTMQAGGFPCNQLDIQPDCTGFAVAALTAVEAPVDCGAVGAYWQDRYDAGAYGDNTNTQAWALIALESCNQSPPEEAWGWLLALQLDDGSFAYQPGNPGHVSTRLLATADAVLALADFPGPAYAPISIETPGASAPETGETVRAVGAFEQFTWHDGTTGQSRVITPADELLRVYGVGVGTHGRAAYPLPAEVSEEAPIPWALPVVALLATLRLRAPLGRR